MKRPSVRTLIELASRLAGFDAGEVSAGTPDWKNGGHWVEVRGIPFRNDTRICPGRVCPDCLDEDISSREEIEVARPYRRDFWQMPLVGSCPRHSRLLVSTCWHCSKPLDVLSPVLRCSCSRWSDVRRAPVTRIPEEQLGHDRWVLDRMGLGDPSYHSFLDQLGIDAASRLCFLLGCAMVSKERLPLTPRCASADEPGIRNAGWSVLVGGSESLAAFLDARIDLFGRKAENRNHPLSWYGGLHTLLSKRREPELDVMRDCIRQHARQRLRLSAKYKVFGESVTSDQSVTLIDLASSLGLNKSKPAVMLGEMKLRTPSLPVRCLESVSLEAAESVRKIMERTVIASELEARLGCSKRDLLALQREGVLPRVIPPSGGMSGLVSRDDALRLETVFNGGSVVSAARAANLFSVSRAGKNGFDLVWIARALLSRQIEPAGRIKNLVGASGLLFRSQDLDEALLRLTGMVRVSAALSNRGWRQAEVNALRHLGLMPARSERHMSAREFDEVLEKVVSAREVASWLPGSATPFAVVGMLRKAGLKSLGANPNPTALIWLRAEAKALVDSLHSRS